MENLDTANLMIINESQENLFFFRQFVECFKCPLIQTASLYPNTSNVVNLKTFYNQKYAIVDRNESYLLNQIENISCSNYCSSDCLPSLITSLADQGKYRLTIHQFGNCSWDIIEYGQNDWLQFLITIIIYFAIICTSHFGIGRYFYSRNQNRSNVPNDDNIITGSIENEYELALCFQRNRYNSIDTFRGLTILLMIFVNYGAGQYHWLQHAPWDGLHLADLVFPFFIFIMGATIAVGFKNISRRPVSKDMIKEKLIKICIRSAKLFLLGLVINSIGSSDITTIRIPGVLQRFALSYGIVASVHLLSIVANKWYLSTNLFLQKIFPLWMEYSLAIIMIFIYSYFTFYWEFDPGCPIGYIGPGGLYDNGSHPFCVGGSAHKIDELIFTSKHCYKGYFGSILYDPDPRIYNPRLWHDPEGLLGTSTSIVLTLIGFQVGHILAYNHEPWARVRKWSLLVIILAISTILNVFVYMIPINKNLWSISFVTATGCLATILFASFYLVIDNQNQYLYWPEGWPFNYAGQNSIFLYMGHEIVHDMLPFTLTFPTDHFRFLSGHIPFLMSNLIGTTVWLLISIHLAKKHFFLTV
ncbi:hypothetical protein BLOT_000310 [Blomia tropicalis]|nr:hypothetical protein BLOT_000310 [Blomia tropicalis]